MRSQKYIYSLALILGTFMFLPKFLCAQDEQVIKDLYKKTEIGLTFGANNFLGDLGGNLGAGGVFLKDYTFKTVRPLVGFSFAYYPQNWYELKISANYSSVDGADSLIPKTDDLARWRIYRNLSFNSHISEVSITGQFYPLTFFSPDRDVRHFSPFIEFGFGVFHFNPTAQLNGQTIFLQPLHIEGEGFAEYPNSKNYSLTQLYLPTSIGLKYYLNDEFSFSVGATFRKTFTDYIDDVSENYIDPSLFSKYLSPSQAAIATQLYKRVLPQYESKVGTVRGFNGDDTYVTFFLSVNFAIQRFINFYYGSHYDRDGQLERQ